MSFNVKQTYALASDNNIPDKIRDVLSGGLKGANGSLILGTAGNVATGTANTVVGTDAAISMTYAASNTIVGNTAGQDLTIGDFSTFIGASCGKDVTTGDHNTGLGYLACAAAANALTGVRNTCLGSACGENLQAGASNNTFIGYNAGNAATNVTGSIAIGAGTVVTASRQLVLGSTTVPLRTTGASGAQTGYLRVTVNGLDRLITLLVEP